ncbi:MAG: type IX secretion system membrane protein PorP/SprF [Flavobacteriales bacterium]|nr:type IX secretion system membrane protein PorP/SprF [Flavobacteriales bacterium]
MMSRLLTISFLLMLLGAEAQQIQQYSQFFMNDYALNPGIAGLRENIEVRSNNRYQWEGITDAPRTYTLSINVPVADEGLGFGAYLFTDIVGPTRRIGFQAGGSYHLPLNDKMKLGIGFSVGVLEYSVDGEKIELADNGDGALMNLLGTTRVVDAKAGVILNAEDFYVGFSVPQIAQNNLDIYASSVAGSSTLVTHYFLMGGYRYEINEDYTIEPNVLAKYVSPAPIKLDISLRGIWKDKVWLGGGYRNGDAFVAMVGVRLNDQILIGYSHDFTTSDIQNYSSGTHEIMLGLDIPKPE